MIFTPEIIAVMLAMVFFYFRMAQLRGQKRRYQKDYALKRRKVGGRSKGSALPQDPPGTPPYGITSWWLVALAMLLMLFGLGLFNKMFSQLDQYARYWYIPVCLGTILFAFCFKVRKPVPID